MKKLYCLNLFMFCVLTLITYLNLHMFFGKNSAILKGINQAMDDSIYADGFYSRYSDMQIISRSKNLRTSTCSVNSKPRRSILYIKVHKTGSTTLRSTLLVYGQKYNLTICMDSTNLWGLNWPYTVDEEKLTKLQTERCNLVAEEMVYDKKTVQRLFNDDVFIMASVRYPVDHFMSLFKYTGLQKAVEQLVDQKLDLWESVRLFLRNPSLVKNTYATFKEEEVRDKLQANLIRPNLQSYSLGITSSNADEIMKQAAEFNFFVVAEHFDKSMVVLKAKLCCTLQDVVYRHQNMRRSTEERKQLVPKDIKKAILEFNKGDLILYNMALKQLVRERENFHNFEANLKEYRNELAKYEKYCAKSEDLCPPKTNGQIGVFVEKVRASQRTKLLEKLKTKYKSRF